MAEKVPILVVLGIDMDGKPHASRFAEHDAPFVQRAAELMGFHVVRVPPDNAELHGIAKGLPLGKIFATGRAFVPFVRRSAFDKLATLVEGGVTIEARAAAGVAPVYPLADMFTTEAANTADALWSKSRSAPSCSPHSRISMVRAGGRAPSSASTATISRCVGWKRRRRSPSAHRAAMSRCAIPAPSDGPRLVGQRLPRIRLRGHRPPNLLIQPYRPVSRE